MRITPKFVGRLVGRLVDTDNLPETEMVSTVTRLL